MQLCDNDTTCTNEGTRQDWHTASEPWPARQTGMSRDTDTCGLIHQTVNSVAAACWLSVQQAVHCGQSPSHVSRETRVRDTRVPELT